MGNNQINIRPGRQADAPAIARAVIMAVGEEIALSLAGSAERRHLVDETFTRLAARTDSQYSYLNTLVAETPDGEIAGLIVSYDGADLHRLRRAFIREANEVLGIHFDENKMDDETSPDEIYLDSLAVFPEFRGHQLGRRLIEAAAEHHAASGKPLGLLCDPDNPRAQHIYEKLGFKTVGRRPFAGVMMHHMTRCKN